MLLAHSSLANSQLLSSVELSLCVFFLWVILSLDICHLICYVSMRGKEVTDISDFCENEAEMFYGIALTSPTVNANDLVSRLNFSLLINEYRISFFVV